MMDNDRWKQAGGVRMSLENQFWKDLKESEVRKSWNEEHDQLWPRIDPKD